MKKIILLATSMITCIGFSASPAPTTITQGDFTFEVLNDTSVCLTAYTGSEPELVVPASLTVNKKTYRVTKIGDNCCNGNNAIEVLKVPNPVGRIGMRAFAGCNNLKTIVLPASITYLGEFCFAIDPVESVTVYAINPPGNPGSSEWGMTNTTSWWSYNNIFKGSASYWNKFESLTSETSANAEANTPSLSDQYVDATLFVPPMSLSKYKECSFDEGSKREGVWGLFKRIEEIPDYLSGLDDIFTGASESAKAPATIYDITGRTVKENATVNDIQSLPQGLYIFKGKKYVVGN